MMEIFNLAGLKIWYSGPSIVKCLVWFDSFGTE